MDIKQIKTDSDKTTESLNTEEQQVVNEHFKLLVHNAIDFLEKSVNYFENDLKVSIICLCSAVELFLKARIIKIDWKLIFKKQKNATIENFINKEFTSINSDEAKKILQKYDKDSLYLINHKVFEELKDLRNNIIHFFSEDTQNEDKDRIIINRYKALYCLDKLLQNQWKKFFKDYDSELTIVTKMLLEHKPYLQIKYDNLQDELKSYETKETCNVCSFKSSVKTNIYHKLITEFTCKVCETMQLQIKYNCHNCKTDILLKFPSSIKLEHQELNTLICTKCDDEIVADDIHTYLANNQKTIYATDSDNLDQKWVTCGYCEKEGSCAELEKDYYFCLNCFAFASGISKCQYCNHSFTGKDTLDEENSYVFGCRFCEGYLGNNCHN